MCNHPSRNDLGPTAVVRSFAVGRPDGAVTNRTTEPRAAIDKHVWLLLGGKAKPRVASLGLSSKRYREN